MRESVGLTEERGRLSLLLGYPVCGRLMGFKDDGTPSVCGLSANHAGGHLGEGQHPPSRRGGRLTAPRVGS